MSMMVITNCPSISFQHWFLIPSDAQIQPLHACLQTAKIQPFLKISWPSNLPIHSPLNDYNLSKTTNLQITLDPTILTPIPNGASFPSFPMPCHHPCLHRHPSIQVLLAFPFHVYANQLQPLLCCVKSQQLATVCDIISQICKSTSRAFQDSLLQ